MDQFMALLIEDVGALIVDDDEAFVIYADDGLTVLFDGTQHRLNGDEEGVRDGALATLIAMHKGSKEAQRRRSLRANYDAWEDMFVKYGIPDDQTYGEEDE